MQIDEELYAYEMRKQFQREIVEIARSLCTEIRKEFHYRSHRQVLRRPIPLPDPEAFNFKLALNAIYELREKSKRRYTLPERLLRLAQRTKRDVPILATLFTSVRRVEPELVTRLTEIEGALLLLESCNE